MEIRSERDFCKGSRKGYEIRRTKNWELETDFLGRHEMGLSTKFRDREPFRAESARNAPFRGETELMNKRYFSSFLLSPRPKPKPSKPQPAIFRSSPLLSSPAHAGAAARRQPPPLPSKLLSPSISSATVTRNRAKIVKNTPRSQARFPTIFCLKPLVNLVH